MYKGVFVAIVTPFKNGKIDTDALRNHVSRLIENGANGIVPCGTTGEGATLVPSEYSQIVKTVVSEVNKKVPVIAGAGSNSTVKAVELAKIVIEAGADATLQVTPYYNKPMQEGLFEHFKKIAEEVSSPHILYNVPGRTSVNMLPETVARLSKIKNILGIKEASGKLEQVEEIRRSTRPEFIIFSGNDDQNLDIYKKGGAGSISVTANVTPDRVVSVWQAFQKGDITNAEFLQKKLTDLNDAMFYETNPIPVKTSLALMEKCTEEFRLPLTPMSKQNKIKLENILRQHSIIR